MSLSDHRTSQLVTSLRNFLGQSAVLDDDSSLEHYGRDWLKKFHPRPSCIVFPQTTEDVQKIIFYAKEQGCALVPSGGRTGLSGGATACNKEVVVSTERMTAIKGFDEIGRLLTVEAGVLTQSVHDYLLPLGYFFPIDFASKGSSMIGGNVATNAGGIRVIRWGLIREWVAGLTVVTGNGDILKFNGTLVKDQSGYDLKNVFIGSEGTLGIITEVVLKVTELPGDCIRVLCGAHKVESLMECLPSLRKKTRGLSMFEYFSQECLDCLEMFGEKTKIFSDPFPHYGLMEFDLSCNKSQEDIELVLSELLENGLLGDVLISASRTQADEFLAFREKIPEIINAKATLHKNDISVPLASLPRFLPALRECIATYYPDAPVACFGHLGDGNLHVNILKPPSISAEYFAEMAEQGDKALFTLIASFQGSISAEHGVGLLKKPYLQFTRSEKELHIMRAVKSLFDPQSLLNPGKIF